MARRAKPKATRQNQPKRPSKSARDRKRLAAAERRAYPGGLKKTRRELRANTQPGRA
jgi:hypothetical protein